MSDEDAELLRTLAPFRRDAAAFCAYIDDARRRGPIDRYGELLRLLSNLAASGCQLGYVDSDEPNDDLPTMGNEDYRSMSQEIDAVTLETVIALDEYNDSIGGDTGIMLFDDLSDIYRDLSLGLRLIERGHPGDVAKAAWNWHFQYESHWGTHLCSALAAVHAICCRLYRR